MGGLTKQRSGVSWNPACLPRVLAKSLMRRREELFLRAILPKKSVAKARFIPVEPQRPNRMNFSEALGKFVRFRDNFRYGGCPLPSHPCDPCCHPRSKTPSREVQEATPASFRDIPSQVPSEEDVLPSRCACSPSCSSRCGRRPAPAEFHIRTPSVACEIVCALIFLFFDVPAVAGVASCWGEGTPVGYRRGRFGCSGAGAGQGARSG